jgi:hypothetical protein
MLAEGNKKIYYIPVVKESPNLIVDSINVDENGWPLYKEDISKMIKIDTAKKAVEWSWQLPFGELPDTGFDFAT